MFLMEKEVNILLMKVQCNMSLNGMKVEFITQ